jgi:hypothetical protein
MKEALCHVNISPTLDDTLSRTSYKLPDDRVIEVRVRVRAFTRARLRGRLQRACVPVISLASFARRTRTPHTATTPPCCTDRSGACTHRAPLVCYRGPDVRGRFRLTCR